MKNLGLSGRLTELSIQSPLTPLFLLAALVLGLIALLTIPREEEPQISVPMVDIQVRADGLRAHDAAELITKPLEEIVKSIDDVEHVYSQTADDQVLVTARFLVGTDADSAILRVHEKVRANYGRIPHGIPEPLISGRGINDVAIVVLTLSADKQAADMWNEASLYRIAAELQSELAKVDNVGFSYLSGGSPESIRIEPDPEKMALYGVTLQQLIDKVNGANKSFSSGKVKGNNKTYAVVAGQTLAGEADIGLLLLTARNGRPVYVKDVARIMIGATPVENRVMTLRRDGEGSWEARPAISLALAKRAGANAVVVSRDILDRVETLKGTLIPEGIHVEVTRNYGRTADEKANELLFHLFLATITIVALIGFSIGWREAFVTLIVIPATILLTLLAAYLMGYTINRVSLFALIFSIGILVDDAIVVVENISRHWRMNDGRSQLQGAIEAVAEVGNPTIIATLTVVAALLPMTFVSGLMGPYMAPIPVNASAAMLFSFFMAIAVAPWLMMKVSALGKKERGQKDEGAIGRLYRKVAQPVIRTRKNSLLFLLSVGIVTLISFLPFATRSVTVKLLPFDNKSELQIVLDLQEGSTMEETERVLHQIAEELLPIPEIRSVQSYAGIAAPFNFNGLVRHYYLRQSPELGELQVNLSSKHERKENSHEIALHIRNRLEKMNLPSGTVLKVVEVPPGPPVLATLLAEIYGPDQESRQVVVRHLKSILKSVPYIVDVDDSIGASRPRLHVSIDQDRLEFFGVEQEDVYGTIQSLIGGVPAGYSYRGEGRDPLEIVIQMPKTDLNWTERLASTPVPANAMPGDRSVVELGDVVSVKYEEGSPVLFRHNGHFTDMIMAELAGSYEAPVYGMQDVGKLVKRYDWGTLTPPKIKFHGQPEDPMETVLLWDGEWEITYVTFRDMGIAFVAALLGIYILVAAQFHSFKLPFVILTPIPLTFIGIITGHWLFNAPFTATSMIGFIALAGIIVRNSILLADFIRHRQSKDAPLRDVLLDAGAVRFKPILLTALAAMIGAASILGDPIFQGLAISLLFGLASSTLLTVLVIPAIYILLRGDAYSNKKFT
ncbi:MAG: efflux RND transporter permease subunit [Micavibrio aeruginosavorus]|uniref:Efflux RND transporter permease subunit n=1 Tax=Micavibrio aeruginosavorus TaxID=349221 RepID=A0A7T5UH66_9BACT|nr:MAG: efflux RND transporter permease subunit [Micavibrio aeruginosavorus]